MASPSVLYPWDPLPSVGEHVTLSMRTGLLHVTSSQTALLDICMSSLALTHEAYPGGTPYTPYAYCVQSGKPEHAISLVRMLASNSAAATRR